MKTITPANTPTPEQKKQAARVVEDASAASIDTAVDQLIEENLIDREGLQRFFGKGDRLKKKFIPFLKAIIIELSTVVKGCLKLLSGGREIIIAPTEGLDILANANDVFTAWIDPDLVNWGTDKSDKNTEATRVEVYEMTENADFKKIFGSFDKELDDLCLTQAQIKSFAKNHRDWLRQDGWATFFLFKVEDDFFVASVGVVSVGLHLGVHRFEHDGVWDAEGADRVVVPQQAL